MKRVFALPRSTIVAAAVFFSAASAHATPVVINTMPDPGDITTVEQTFTSFQWFGLAAGFTVPTFGTVTGITAALTARASLGRFYVGLASNDMIGNPSTPSYFDPPPGSLWETTVCSTQLSFGDTLSGCDAEPSAVELGANEYLDLTGLGISLPSAGTYWLYTRFVRDDVFASWTKNVSAQSDLIARESGVCAGASVGSCDRLADRTFFQVGAPDAAPGLRIEYEPGLRIPEPATFTLVVASLLGLAAARRRRPTTRSVHVQPM